MYKTFLMSTFDKYVCIIPDMFLKFQQPPFLLQNEVTIPATTSSWHAQEEDQAAWTQAIAHYFSHFEWCFTISHQSLFHNLNGLVFSLLGNVVMVNMDLLADWILQEGARAASYVSLGNVLWEEMMCDDQIQSWIGCQAWTQSTWFGGTGLG